MSPSSSSSSSSYSSSSSTFRRHVNQNTVAAMLIAIIFAVDLVNPVPAPQTSTISANETVDNNDLESLTKQIEKINSTIQQLELEESRNQGNGPEEVEKAELQKEMDILGMKIDAEEAKSSNRNGTSRKHHKKEKGGGSTLDVKKVPSSTTDASRLLCQFFVFGILFGIVCTISACSCIFRSRRNSIRPDQQNTGGIEANLSRLSRIQEPFAPDKPFCLKFDKQGNCYASPLTREVPPLPNYEEACKMRTASELLSNSHSKKQQSENNNNSEQQQKKVSSSSTSTTTTTVAAAAAEAILSHPIRIKAWI